MKKEFLPLSVPNLKGREIELASDAIASEWVSTGGSYVSDFEEALSAYVGSGGAVACQSGTAGLHLSLIAAGVSRGDAVIVPTLTFIAAVNPVTYVGAEPLFMDCDDSLCIDPIKLRQFCEEECSFDGVTLTHTATHRRVSALMVVHVFGNMADMETLVPLAEEYGLVLIEDATEALGTYYQTGCFAGKHAGTMGHVGVYSFNGNKIITTGGGGMIVSDDQSLLARTKHLSTQAKSDVVYFEHDEIGYNYRMTNVQAALGIAQLERIEEFIETKAKNYELYRELLSGQSGVSLLPFREGTRSNKWFYSLVCEKAPYERDALIAFLAEKHMQARPVWGLISDQKPYRGSISYRIERARWYRDRIVNIPCSTNLSSDDVRSVVGTIREIRNHES